MKYSVYLHADDVTLYTVRTQIRYETLTVPTQYLWSDFHYLKIHFSEKINWLRTLEKYKTHNYKVSLLYYKQTWVNCSGK